MAESRPPLVLASASGIRRKLLAGAGLHFAVDAADVDERAILALAAVSALDRPQQAAWLAAAKAQSVGRRHQGAVVIGADQMLELDGDVLHKAPDAPAARATLWRMRGRAHRLHSGWALYQDGQLVRSGVSSATLHVRSFSEAWLDAYVAANSEALTSAVGAYQLEGQGIQLFERIEGDYFTILGLPLLPLLAELRRLAIIET